MAFTDVLMQNVGVEDSTFTLVDSDDSSRQVKFTVADSATLTLPTGIKTLATTDSVVTIDTPSITVTDTTSSSAIEGGSIRLVSNDGAAMGEGHRLGVIEFAGAEDVSNTITVGARIESLCDVAWSGTENGSSLLFYTTDGDASQSEVLKLDSNKLATITGDLKFGTHTRFYSLTGDTATTNATQIWTIDLGITKAVYQVKAFFAGSDPTNDKGASYELTGLFRHSGSAMTQLGTAGGAKAGLGNLSNICTLSDANLNVTGDDIQITVTPGATDAIDWRGYVSVITATV